MTRGKIIDVLTEDRLTDWVYAQNTDGLEEMLMVGWKDYEDYSDQELKEALESLDEDQIKDYLQASKARLAKKSKRWEDEKPVAFEPKI